MVNNGSTNADWTMKKGGSIQQGWDFDQTLGSFAKSSVDETIR